MFKKIRVFALAIIMLFSLIIPFGCGKAQTPQSNVYVVSATDKYCLEQKITNFSEKIDISMARNEYESAQIIVNPSRNIRNLDMSITDLVGETDKISKDKIEFYLEWYVYVSEQGNRNIDVGYGVGYYPDALVPLAKSKELGENRVKKNQNQGIIITISPIDAPAGKYNGIVTLALDNEKIDIDICVNVFDFALSEQNHAKTAFSVWDNDVTVRNMLFYGYLNTDYVIAENYYEFMLDYKVSPTRTPNVDYMDVDKQAEQVIKYAHRNDVSCVGLPFTFSNKSPWFDEGNMSRILKKIAIDSVNNQNVLDKYYVYFNIIDEPTAKNYAKVSQVCSAFQRLKESVAAELLVGVDEQVKRQFLDIQNVITSHYDENKVAAGLVGDYGIDTWCPTFDWYDTEEYQNIMKERSKTDGTWWYGCVNPCYPYPTYMINDNLVSARALNWMQMDYGIQGNLYWSVNVDMKMINNNYEWRNVWTDALSWENSYGEGYLTYPGLKYGMNKPIASLRLENIRAGNEDYEYLYKLKELYENGKPRALKKTFNEYIDMVYRQLFQGTIAIPDSKLLELSRLEIAKLIELAQKNIFVDFDENILNGKVTLNVYSASELTNVTAAYKNIPNVESVDGFNVYSGSFYLDRNSNYINVLIEQGDNKFSLNRFSGLIAQEVSKFDTDNILADITKTDYSKYDNLEDINFSLDNLSMNGKSLKVEMSPIPEAALSYVPKLTINKTLDLSDKNFLHYSVYNDSVSAKKIMIIVKDVLGNTETIWTTYAKPKEWSTSTITIRKALLGKINIKEISSITFSFEKADDISYSLFFDNLYLK